MLIEGEMRGDDNGQICFEDIKLIVFLGGWTSECASKSRPFMIWYCEFFHGLFRPIQENAELVLIAVSPMCWHSKLNDIIKLYLICVRV